MKLSAIKGRALIAIIIIAAVAAGIVIGRGMHRENADVHRMDVSSPSKKKIKYWTCAMHPQIKLPKPGKCPICSMTLIPVMEGEGEKTEAPSLTLGPVGRKLAGVETSPVEYRNVSHTVRMVGKVDYDESRLAHIAAWVPGRIDRLYVDFTGIKVKKGDHLVYLYSPELLSAQEEYLQAIKNLSEVGESHLNIIKETSKDTVTNAREKLRLFGITEEQIKDIEREGRAHDHMTIYSPIAGTVIHKDGFEGMYVKTGTRIYTIADLSEVWVYLDAYESDIQWIRYGQKVEIEAEAYPGEIFYGRIAFINPFLNDKTRTIKVRIDVENTDGRLLPGMFVRAKVKTVLGRGGKIIDPDLAGKWICPMHPGFIRDTKGKCSICGMDLVSAKDLGFTAGSPLDIKVLVIPKTAPLITGERAVVYVDTGKEGDRRRYEGREVILGARAGDWYIVKSGLKEGEMVVTSGNFKIDSALQILAKPSMMEPGGYYGKGDAAK